MVFGMGISKPFARLFEQSRAPIPFGRNTDGIDAIKSACTWRLLRNHKASAQKSLA
jgi:hypothetical protein